MSCRDTYVTLLFLTICVLWLYNSGILTSAAQQYQRIRDLFLPHPPAPETPAFYTPAAPSRSSVDSIPGAWPDTPEPKSAVRSESNTAPTRLSDDDGCVSRARAAYFHSSGQRAAQESIPEVAAERKRRMERHGRQLPRPKKVNAAPVSTASARYTYYATPYAKQLRRALLQEELRASLVNEKLDDGTRTANMPTSSDTIIEIHAAPAPQIPATRAQDGGSVVAAVPPIAPPTVPNPVATWSPTADMTSGLLGVGVKVLGGSEAYAVLGREALQAWKPLPSYSDQELNAVFSIWNGLGHPQNRDNLVETMIMDSETRTMRWESQPRVGPSLAARLAQAAQYLTAQRNAADPASANSGGRPTVGSNVSGQASVAGDTSAAAPPVPYTTYATSGKVGPAAPPVSTSSDGRPTFGPNVSGLASVAGEISAAAPPVPYITYPTSGDVGPAAASGSATHSIVPGMPETAPLPVTQPLVNPFSFGGSAVPMVTSSASRRRQGPPRGRGTVHPATPTPVPESTTQRKQPAAAPESTTLDFDTDRPVCRECNEMLAPEEEARGSCADCHSKRPRNPLVGKSEDEAMDIVREWFARVCRRAREAEEKMKSGNGSQAAWEWYAKETDTYTTAADIANMWRQIREWGTDASSTGPKRNRERLGPNFTAETKIRGPEFNRVFAFWQQGKRHMEAAGDSDHFVCETADELYELWELVTS